MTHRQTPSLVFVLTLAGLWLTRFPETNWNEQARQAGAFLQGHLWLSAPPWIETVTYAGHQQSLHGLGPALLMVPATLLGIPQGIVALFLTAATVAAGYQLLRQRLPLESSLWLTCFLGFGTILWYEGTRGTTWALPMITATMWTLLALSSKGWSGVFIAAASLCRYELFFVTPLVAFVHRRRQFREQVCFFVPVIIAGLLVVAFNWGRYGTLYDYGMTLVSLQNGHSQLMSLAWLPRNLNTLLVMPPVFSETWPWLRPSYMGQSLLWTSPAFLLALNAPWCRLETWLLWIAALVVSLPSLLCWATGYSQFGARHYIQAYPFLLLLVANGLAGDRLGQLGKVLVVLSVLLCAYGQWYIHAYPQQF